MPPLNDFAPLLSLALRPSPYTHLSSRSTPLAIPDFLVPRRSPPRLVLHPYSVPLPFYHHLRFRHLRLGPKRPLPPSRLCTTPVCAPPPPRGGTTRTSPPPLHQPCIASQSGTPASSSCNQKTTPTRSSLPPPRHRLDSRPPPPSSLRSRPVLGPSTICHIPRTKRPLTRGCGLTIP